MAPDSIIVQYIGWLLLAILSGTAQPLPADRLAGAHLPAPVVFAAAWPVPGTTGHRVDSLIVLAGGSMRPGGTSSIVSPRRASEPGTGG